MALDRYLDLRGLTFHYRDWGGAGRPIVLLHGLASNCRIWDLTAPLLMKGQPTFRIIALDQRGHGQSAKPEEGYDFPAVVEDLALILEALELERPIIVGHSWGGNVALQFGAQYPERAAGLVLIDGGYIEIAAIPGLTWERVREELAPPELEGLPLEGLMAMAQGDFQLGRIWSPQLEEILLASFELMADGSVRPRLSRDRHLRIVRALWEQPVSDLYRWVGCPCLLIRAQREPTTERERFWTQAVEGSLRRALELLPQARLIVMVDTIHDIPLQRPGELAAAIADFAAALP